MSANLSAVPKLQFFDNNGNPLVGGKLYTYAAGTTTPLATYTDASAGTPNTNPIILDSRGEANVWLLATTYKFLLTDSTDATIWTVDNISNSLSLSQILAASGSAASPPYTFASDTDTGMYLAAVGQLGLTVAGTPVLRSTDSLMVLDVDLNITGTARRITGDFTNATIADRVMFQTSTVNADAVVGVLPNGTAGISAFNAYNNSNPTNASYAQLAAFSTDVRVNSDKHGSGSYLPMTFYTSGTERMRVDASGNVGIGTTSPGSFDSAWNKLIIGGGSGDVGQTIYSGSSSIGTMAFADGISGAQQYAGLIRYLHASDAMTFWANATERMRITSAGDVGIGSTNPTYSLEIDKASGSFRVRDATGGNDVAIRSVAGPVSLIGSTSNTPIGFTTNNIERTRIAADGSQSSVIPSGSTLYPQFACRAWINFDGAAVVSPASMTGVRASGNVSSVLDNGTGDYTINFTTAMPDANYAVAGTASKPSAGSELILVPVNGSFLTSSIRVITETGGGTNFDPDTVSVAIFR
jgi:hypothetical protein